MKRSKYNTLITKVIMGFSVMSVGTTAIASLCNKSVTSETTPSSDFNKHGDGTVTHKTTGLMWKVCSEGQNYNNGLCEGGLNKVNWKSALEKAESSTYASHSDWRLPNINELNSIVELACQDPAVNEAVFPSTSSRAYWTSSPYAGSGATAWAIKFFSGTSFTSSLGSDQSGKSDSIKNYVRLVRN